MIKDGAETSGKILSFLMIGQSNMAGRGELGDVPAIRNPKCHMLRMGRWQPMSEPVNPDRDIFTIKFHSGISLAASFADEAAKHLGCDVGLIPCADGGTGIAQWQPGEVLFDHAVMMTRLALRTSKLGGIIWHQGESDCAEYDETGYKAALLNMICAIRKELDAQELPFIMGELSENICAKEYQLGDAPKRMNRLLHSMAEEIPRCEVARAATLPLKPDGLHFASISCRELGKRYFECYKAITGK